jgi:hypothetical protein
MSSNDIKDTCAIINNVIAVENLSTTTLNNLIDAVDGIQTLSERDQLQKGDTGRSIRNATLSILLAVVADTGREKMLKMINVKKSIG